MTKAEALARLRAHEAELRALGIERLSIFGSTARGEEGTASDVDLAVTLPGLHGMTLFDFVAIKQAAAQILGADVDMVSEPAKKPKLQAEIDRDRVHVF